MKVRIINRDIYDKCLIYRDLSSAERKYYSFIKCHNDVEPDKWYECYFAGQKFDRNLEHIVGMDIDIKTVPGSTFCLRLRVDMSDIANKFIEFADFYKLNCAELCVKIANLQTGSLSIRRIINDNNYNLCSI